MWVAILGITPSLAYTAVVSDVALSAQKRPPPHMDSDAHAASHPALTPRWFFLLGASGFFLEFAEPNRNRPPQYCATGGRGRITGAGSLYAGSPRQGIGAHLGRAVADARIFPAPTASTLRRMSPRPTSISGSQRLTAPTHPMRTPRSGAKGPSYRAIRDTASCALYGALLMAPRLWLADLTAPTRRCGD